MRSCWRALLLALMGALLCAVPAWADTVFAYMGDVAYYQDETSLIGLVDRSGNVLCEAQFDRVYPFEGDFAVVEFDGLEGVLRRDGKVVVQPRYDVARFDEEGFFELYPSGEDGDADDWGGPVLVADKDGVLLDEEPWASVDMGEGFLTVERTDGSYALLDSKGRERFSLKADEVDYFGSVNEGRVIVRYSDRRYAYLDIQGERIPDRTFDYCAGYDDGRGIFTDGEYRGFVDLDGNTIFQLQCDHLEIPKAYSDGLILFERDKKIGYVDTAGNAAVEPVWDGGSAFYEGTAFVWRDGKYFLIDRTGAVLKAFEWDDPLLLYLYERDHPGFVRVGGKYRMIDRVGNYIGQDAYRDVYRYWSEGLAVVLRDGEDRWSYVNERGEVELAGDWAAAEAFDGGCALVQDAKSGLWGIIDREGRYVVEPVYPEVVDHGPYIAAGEDDECWLLNRRGEKLCPGHEYDLVEWD